MAKQNEAQKPALNVKSLVEQVGGKFQSIIEESGLSLSWEKEKAYAIMTLSENPMLAKCTPASIQKAVYNVALTGLSLNPKLAHCYLVPRGGKAVLDISYQGLLYIMTNSLNVNRIHTDVIYQNDNFNYFINEQGTKLTHQPNLFSDRGEKIGAYAVAWLNGTNDCVAVVLNKQEIEKIKAVSQSAKSSYSPWSNFEDEMWKKTSVRRLWKMIPKTNRIEQVVDAIEVDNDNFDADFKKQAPEPKKQVVDFDDFTTVEEVEENEVQEQAK